MIVGIDDRTLADSSYPLNRRRHARVIRNLTEAKAGVVAVDVQFTEQSAFPDADTALIEAVRASPKVVLATTEVAPDGSTAIFGGGEGLKYSRATPANANVTFDADGALRRFAAESQGLESFAFAAARLQTGDAPQLDEPTALIDFPGPAGTIRQLSFRRRRVRQLRPGGRARQDRGHRRHRAAAPRPAPHGDQPRRCRARRSRPRRSPPRSKASRSTRRRIGSTGF